ncbi:hypothetical protein J6590_042793 [Homalodisca vitripennis]|nr:hypothetical protein J6590_042793 [Homalodisca vitripennis]
MQLDGESAENPQDICDLFARFFSSTYRPSSLNPPVYNLEATTSIFSCQFTCEDVEAELRSLDTNKGAGPNDISPMILKHCSEQKSYEFFLSLDLKRATDKPSKPWGY